MAARLKDGSRIMDDDVPAEIVATAIDNHVDTMAALEVIRTQRDKAVHERNAFKAEAALLREKIAEFLTDGLVAIAGAVCTPEAGYLVDGGLWGFLADVKSLRKQHDALQKTQATL